MFFVTVCVFVCCVEKKVVCFVLYDYDGLLSVCLFVVCDVVKLLSHRIFLWCVHV